MTLQQIEKIRDILSRIDSVQGFNNTKKLVVEIRSFYKDEFNVPLNIDSCSAYPKLYTAEYNEWDKISIKSFLEGYIAREKNAEIICSILDLIEEGERIKQNECGRENFAHKIYYSYYGKIAFDDNMKNIITAPKGYLRIYSLSITEEMVVGLITKLKLYVTQLLQDNKAIATNHTKQEINFQPHINV